MHFRNQRKKRTEFNFTLKGSELEKVDIYKYLGFYMHEHMNFEINEERLAESGSRALGSIINKFKQMKNVGYYSLLNYTIQVLHQFWTMLQKFGVQAKENIVIRFKIVQYATFWVYINSVRFQH